MSKKTKRKTNIISPSLALKVLGQVEQTEYSGYTYEEVAKDIGAKLGYCAGYVRTGLTTLSKYGLVHISQEGSKIISCNVNYNNPVTQKLVEQTPCEKGKRLLSKRKDMVTNFEAMARRLLSGETEVVETTPTTVSSTKLTMVVSIGGASIELPIDITLQSH